MRFLFVVGALTLMSACASAPKESLDYKVEISGAYAYQIIGQSSYFKEGNTYRTSIVGYSDTKTGVLTMVYTNPSRAQDIVIGLSSACPFTSTRFRITKDNLKNTARMYLSVNNRRYYGEIAYDDGTISKFDMTCPSAWGLVKATDKV